MSAEWVRKACMAFPGVTETVQWGNDLVFKIEGKMFAVLALEPSAIVMSFKCSDEKYAELVEAPGIVPAPYLARAKWVGFEKADALPRQETLQLLRAAYDIVLAKLPKKTRAKYGA